MPTFSNLGDFLAQLPTVIDRALKKAADEVAREVQERAQGKLGVYQPGWTPLSDATREDRVASGFPADEPLLRSGGLRDSIQQAVDRLPNGYRAVVGSDAPQARVQELGGQAGTAFIPPRPYLAPAVVELEDKIQETVAARIAKELQEL